MARAPTTAAGSLPSSSSSHTTTVILPNGSSSSQPPETLVLRLNRKKKTVSWKEGTVDNEFMQKKSSKKCCVFHKKKPFDEDDSDQDDDPGHNHRHENRSPSCSGANGGDSSMESVDHLEPDGKLMFGKTVGQDSATEHLKLTITLLHGKHGPHAWEQSGRLEPVGKFLLDVFLAFLLACCHGLSCSVCSRARSRSVG